MCKNASSVLPGNEASDRLATAAPPTKKLCAEETDPEVETRTKWAALLDDIPATAATRTLPAVAREHYGDAMIQIDRLLTDEECARLNAAAEAIGFGRTNYPQSYRGNLRLITTDQGLADVLWKRIRPMVPEECEARDYKGEHALWRAVGLNERFRLAKYHIGARFGAHVDANFARDDDEMSLLTVNIYTNTCNPEDGGKTRFYATSAVHRATPGEAHIDLAVRPEAGTAMCFLQNPQPEAPLHDGEVLAGGVKYLLRTDVMYRRVRNL